MLNIIQIINVSSYHDNIQSIHSLYYFLRTIITFNRKYQFHEMFDKISQKVTIMCLFLYHEFFVNFFKF